ncbi:hypothetical protein [Knoellia subterranea]|uniref:hypothetical protein n=1 Tax=Knoellia subterranea TaxID=184882 RepID=UPI0012EC9272|nr:hypothetical protein [Knoellia subterranea]
MSLRPLLVTTAVLSVLLPATGCTSDDSATPAPRPSVGARLDWQRLSLPEGQSPVTLTVTEDRVLVGTYGASRPHPHLLSTTDGDTWHEVPLAPRSPYAFEGRWFQIVTHAGRVDAIAGARGGAHGNYRWTTWTGTEDGVAEQEQPFGVFGSYGAGDLAGIAYAAGSPVILGAWQSERTGLDIATWTRAGTRWSRQPSTATPLGSTAESLAAGTAIASAGDGVVVAGSVTRLASGSVTVGAALWSAPGSGGPWTRLDLPGAPATDGPGLADSATCTPHSCLVVGTEDGRFAGWDVTEGAARRADGIPEISVTENRSVVAPVMVGEKDDIVLVPTPRGAVVARRAGTTWSTTDGPSGTPTAAIPHGNDLWVITTDVQGGGTLWRARVR